MTAPIMPWDSEQAFDDEGKVVWWSRLDGRYQCEVQRVTDYTADLFMFDRNNNNEVVLKAPVALSHGAIFGPDVDDVMQWHQMCLAVADAKQLNEPKGN